MSSCANMTYRSCACTPFFLLGCACIKLKTWNS
uniref:Uncharacterized protein n=1 Tax=Setaria italica TaxID=4555 RepID=K4AP92_SETIT